jgi:hypothetical protein
MTEDRAYLEIMKSRPINLAESHATSPFSAIHPHPPVTTRFLPAIPLFTATANAAMS